MKQEDFSEAESMPKKNRRCKYQKISEKLREQIIERLCIKKEGLREVAAKLKINHSTCKAIVKVYESEGRIGKKKTRNRNIDVIETFTFCVVNKGVYEEIPEVKLMEKRVSCTRGQDIDKMLSDTAKTQSEEIAGEMISSRKRIDQIWQQHFHAPQNPQVFNYPNMSMPMYYYGGQYQQGMPNMQTLQAFQNLQRSQELQKQGSLDLSPLM